MKNYSSITIKLLFFMSIFLFCFCNLANKEVVTLQEKKRSFELEVTFASSFDEDIMSIDLVDICSIEKQKVITTNLLDGVTDFQFRVYFANEGYEVETINEERISKCNTERMETYFIKVQLNQSVFSFKINPLKGKFIVFKNNNTKGLFFEQYKTQPIFD